MRAETILPWIEAGLRAGKNFRLRPPRRSRGRSGNIPTFGPGASLEFLQHREYHPGDDPRDIDWNASARSDRIVSKLHGREVEPRLDLVIDFSASMGAGEAGKASSAIGTAAMLETAAADPGWSVRSWIPSASGVITLASILDPSCFPGDAFERGGNPGRTLIDSPPRLRPGSMRVFLSDLMWPTPAGRILDVLTRSAETLVIVRILDRSDSRAPEPGRFRLLDIETGRELEIEITAEISRRYSEAFSRHRRIWEEDCGRRGVFYLEIPSGIGQLGDAADALRLILEPA